MNEMADNRLIAHTILQQLGGAAFMIGMKHPIIITRGVSFGIGRNPKGVTGVVIQLLPSDTYSLEFFKTTGRRVRRSRTLSTATGIYADQLREVIAEHTGMATWL